jgi:hypothetical protein
VRPDPSDPKAQDARWKVFLRIPAAPADGGGEEGRVPVGAYHEGVEDWPTLYSVTHLRDCLYSSWPEEARPVGRRRRDVLGLALKKKSVAGCLVPHPASDLLSSSYIHRNDISTLFRSLGCEAAQRNLVQEEKPPCAAARDDEGVCKSTAMKYAFGSRRALLRHIEKDPTLVRDALLDGNVPTMEDLRPVVLQVPPSPPHPSVPHLTGVPRL